MVVQEAAHAVLRSSGVSLGAAKAERVEGSAHSAPAPRPQVRQVHLGGVARERYWLRQREGVNSRWLVERLAFHGRVSSVSIPPSSPKTAPQPREEQKNKIPAFMGNQQIRPSYLWGSFAGILFPGKNPRSRRKISSAFLG